MSYNELLPEIDRLSAAEKRHLMQWLAENLARDEVNALLPAGVAYPVWSPHDSYEAAHALEQMLRDERESP